MSVALVTGSAGFIGRNLVLRLLGDGDTVVALDRVNGAEPAHREAGSKFIEEIGDADDRDTIAELLERYRPDVIVSLAEGVRGSLAEVVADSAASQSGLFQAALAAGVKRVCLASSLVVYMGLYGPFREDMPLPIHSSIHVGAIKKASEVVGSWYSHVMPLEVVAMRLANIYGPRYHSMMNTPSRYLFEALGRAIPGGKPMLDVELYRQLADFCYVDDCCEGISLIAHAPKLQHRIYNIASGYGVEDEEIRAAAQAASRRDQRVDPIRGANRNYLDITRLSSELGFRPKYDIYRGMRAYREWLEHNDR